MQKTFVMDCGERYCLLVDNLGIPLFYPNLFVTTQIRNRSLSFASMQAALNGIEVVKFMSSKPQTRKVESARLFLSALETSIPKIEASHFGKYERVYTYELYRQLYNLIEKHKSKYPLNVFLHGEAVKLSRVGMELGLYNLPKDKRFDPDLVFHTPETSDNQIAIVEIKVRGLGEKTFFRDLEKLTLFKRSADFEYVIFHSINYGKDDLQKLLKKIPLQQKNTLDSDIVIITRKCLCTSVQRFELSEIL